MGERDLNELRAAAIGKPTSMIHSVRFARSDIVATSWRNRKRVGRVITIDEIESMNMPSTM